MLRNGCRRFLWSHCSAFHLLMRAFPSVPEWGSFIVNEVLAFKLWSETWAVSAEIYSWTSCLDCSLEGLHVSCRELLLIGCCWGESGFLIHPRSAFVSWNLESKLWLSLFSSLTLFVVIVLCLILLGHQSKIEMGISQFLHGTFRQGILRNLFSSKILLVDRLHRLWLIAKHNP